MSVGVRHRSALVGISRCTSEIVGSRPVLFGRRRLPSAVVGGIRQYSSAPFGTRRHRSVHVGSGRLSSVELFGRFRLRSALLPAVGSGFRSLSLYRRVSRQLQTNRYESKATRNPICLRSSRVVSRDVISDDIITRQPTRAGVTSNAHAHHTRRILEIAANNLIIDPSLHAMLSICAEQILTAILSTELSRCALHDHTRDSNVCVFYTNAKVKLVKNA